MFGKVKAKKPGAAAKALKKANNKRRAAKLLKTLAPKASEPTRPAAKGSAAGHGKDRHPGKGAAGKRQLNKPTASSGSIKWSVGDLVYSEGLADARIEAIDFDRKWIQVRRCRSDGTFWDDSMTGPVRMLLMPESIGPIPGDDDPYPAYGQTRLPLCVPEPIEAHRLAKMLPAASDEEVAALRADLRINGQLDPIMLYEGQVLDGRHRQAELMDLGILPKYQELASGMDPVQYLYSKALHRNLDKTQKACAAALLKGEFEATAQARMKSGKKSDPTALVPQGGAREMAGNLFGVSGRYVQEALTLLSGNRELFDAAFSGRVALTKAVRQFKAADAAVTVKPLRPLTGLELIKCHKFDAASEPRTAVEVTEVASILLRASLGEEQMDEVRREIRDKDRIDWVWQRVLLFLDESGTDPAELRAIAGALVAYALDHRDETPAEPLATTEE